MSEYQPPLFCGIDPGISGAWCLIDQGGAVVEMDDLPTLLRGKGRVKRELDPATLAHGLRPFSRDIALAVVESVSSRPGQGVASVFSLGHSSGAIMGVMAALGIPHRLVLPAAWKKAAGLPSKSDKEASRALALRLHPSLARELGRAKDHNRAEALLLAAHARRLAL